MVEYNLRAPEVMKRLGRNPEKRSSFIESCSALGLNPPMSTTFDWLEADDRETFQRKSL